MADAHDRLTAADKEHLDKLEEALFEIRRVIAGQESRCSSGSSCACSRAAIS